jgi:hypothetical protein
MLSGRELVPESERSLTDPVKGHASILSFPFRIYGDAFLPRLDGNVSGGDLRIRIYPPFRVRDHGSPLSPQVPFPAWTAFEWHPKLAKEKRLPPPKDLTPTPFGDRAYDAFRLDAWGANCEQRGQKFARQFLRWIRRLSEQPWIGAFESQTDPLVKGSFQIDEHGNAIDTPYVYAVVQASDGFRHPMRRDEWEEAFRRTLVDEEPETYWLLYMDAVNNQSMQRIGEAILSLALSLEVARDTLLEKFAARVDRSEAGVRLGSPFDGDDLRKHITTHLELASGRNLRTERLDLWQAVDDLYVARHKVAHGKRAIVRAPGGVRATIGEDIKRWITAVRATIVWMEDVSRQHIAQTSP